jgi:hypothetical protein
VFEKGRKVPLKFSYIIPHKATTSSDNGALFFGVPSVGRSVMLMLDQFYMDGSNNGLYYCYYTKPAIMTIKR